MKKLLNSYSGKQEEKVSEEKVRKEMEEDILNIELLKKEYWKTVELPNGINIDIAKDGSITGIEILRASKVFSGDIKKVIEQAKPLVA